MSSSTYSHKPLSVVFVASQLTPRLHAEILARPEADIRSLFHRPKALFPSWIPGHSILDVWWREIQKCRVFAEVYLVVSALWFKHFDRWASANGFPTDHIVNTGRSITSSDDYFLADVDLVVRSHQISTAVLAVAVDMLAPPPGEHLDLSGLVKFFDANNDDVMVCAGSRVCDRASLLCSSRSYGLAFPAPAEDVDLGDDQFPAVALPMLILRPSTLEWLTQYVQSTCTFSFVGDSSNPAGSAILDGLDGALSMHRSLYSFGRGCVETKFIVWTRFLLPISPSPSGDCQLSSYLPVSNLSVPSSARGTPEPQRGDSEPPEPPQSPLPLYPPPAQALASLRSLDEHPTPIVKRVYARVGLMGNPSDGFNGFTLSLSVRNFWAEVTLTPQPLGAPLVLVPHLLYDAMRFGSMDDLQHVSDREGYTGGLRLLQATLKVFCAHCRTRGIPLSSRNFKLSYDTNIPRQVGLAGSSAIITAVVQCLLEFNGLSVASSKSLGTTATASFSLSELPNLILSVETMELGITAGLQDRVAQVYGGLVSMDFNKTHMADRGHGIYTRLSKDHCPPGLWLAWARFPSDSGRIHSTVRQRYDAGDEDVREAMVNLAGLGKTAVDHCRKSDWEGFANLMSKNFDIRRRIFGDGALGALNLELIEIARSIGCHAKFPGSGGAVVGCTPDPVKRRALQNLYESRQFVFTELLPAFYDE